MEPENDTESDLSDFIDDDMTLEDDDSTRIKSRDYENDWKSVDEDVVIVKKHNEH
jgi:hypothetical protein